MTRTVEIVVKNFPRINVVYVKNFFVLSVSKITKNAKFARSQLAKIVKVSVKNAKTISVIIAV